MITILSQDKYQGEILDTKIDANFTITVVGSEIEQFVADLERLIGKYRI